MTKKIILIFTFLFIFAYPSFLYAFQDNPLTNPIQSEIKSDEILIEYKDNTKEEKMSSIEQKNNTKLVDEIEEINVRRVKINGKSNVYETIDEFKSNKEVKNAEPVYLRHFKKVPEDIHFSEQWSLPKIQAPAGWDIEEGFPDNVTVAVIDTGIDINHPDLANKLWINSDETPSDGIDNDNNGFVDDFNGYNIAGKNNNINDDLGHGTEVSGVIAADTDNRIGIAGLSWGAKIMMVKVASEDGWITTSDVTAAIIYAADNGAKVINISLGGNYFSSVENEAIEYAGNRGVTVVAAGGNDESDKLSYPASYDNVISVSATDENDELVYFSNFNKKIDISAPGYNIFTTALNGRYASVSGTSFASPHVAGLAGLILSQNPNLTPLEVEQKIEQTADDLGYPGRDDYFGFGRINVYRALGGNPLQPTQSSKDSYEDNDLFENAKTITINDTIQPNIYPSGDKDWFKFHLGSPAKVSINATPPAEIDILISLYDSSGRLLMQEDPNSTGESEILTKNLAEAGDYYILVNGFYGNASADNYSLSISFSSFSPVDIDVPDISINSPLNNSYLSNYFMDFIDFTVMVFNDVEKVVFFYSSDEGKTWRWFDEDDNGSNGWNGFLGGLGMDGSYKIQALAYDSSQNVGRSTIDIVIDDVPPSKPTGLLASPISKNQINISWSASKDNIGIDKYILYRNDLYLAELKGTFYEDKNLAPDITYAYYIYAADFAENWSSSSDTVLAGTFANQKPTAAIDSIIPSPANQNDVVVFKGNGIDTDGTIAEYLWSFGDSSSSTEQNSNHSYSNPGTYTVSFKVKDNDGAWSEEVSATLIINALSSGNKETVSSSSSNDSVSSLVPASVSGGGGSPAPSIQSTPIPTGKIKGRIINISGLAVLGTPARINSTSVATNLNGEFEFSGLSDGIHTVNYEASGYISQTQVLQVSNGGTTNTPTVIMSLSLPTGKIKGRIINTSRVPILGMPVVVNGTRTATNLNGEFEFNFVADGIYALFYDPTGYINQFQVLAVLGGGATTGPTVIMSSSGGSSVSAKSVKGKKVRKVKSKVKARKRR